MKINLKNWATVLVLSLFALFVFGCASKGVPKTPEELKEISPQYKVVIETGESGRNLLSLSSSEWTPEVKAEYIASFRKYLSLLDDSLQKQPISPKMAKNLGNLYLSNQERQDIISNTAALLKSNKMTLDELYGSDNPNLIDYNKTIKNLKDLDSTTKNVPIHAAEPVYYEELFKWYPKNGKAFLNALSNFLNKQETETKTPETAISPGSFGLSGLNQITISATIAKSFKILKDLYHWNLIKDSDLNSIGISPMELNMMSAMFGL